MASRQQQRQQPTAASVAAASAAVTAATKKGGVGGGGGIISPRGGRSMMLGGGTGGSVPPPSSLLVPSISGGGTGGAGAAPDLSKTILKSLDKRRHHQQQQQSIASATSKSGGASNNATTGGTGEKQQASASAAAVEIEIPPLDPIEFLNNYYTSEQMLVQQLPHLRDAVSDRMQLLDDRISNAIQRQSETAESTRRHVQEAKSSVMALESRIIQVRDKASQSERAVLEITKDMKRLDCAKRHLQRTITTLKRLHMLVNAVEQLRVASLMQPFPDYRSASQLVDATRLLLKHFDSYTQKVEPMKLLSNKVTNLQKDLRLSLVRGFRIVAFGITKTKEMEGIIVAKGAGTTTSPHKFNSFTDGDPDLDDDDEDNEENQTTHPIMTADVMQGGVLLVDALGDHVRTRFIHEFCQDHLANYLREFEPPSQEKDEKQRVSSFRKVQEPEEIEKSNAGIDQIEKRFVWFRDSVVQRVDNKFPKIFPPHWNLQASLARHFLQLTRDHILALLDGPRKDPDADNASILLKALQKTIIFEKDITSWLTSECGAVFQDVSSSAEKPPAAGQQQSSSSTSKEQKPIAPLIGIASASFENYMSPYIKLEEQSMDEQLVEALEDRTVDTRGERPVFISSTNLFVYIKGSITRCTALTKGYAFFLLYQAFKDSLRKYADILNGKLPPSVHSSTTVVGGLPIGIGGLGGSIKQDPATNASYRIPKGEEVTVCHVITTCEYCADTMEALEDLIRETIDDEYKSKVDMMADQDTFHDITAKSIRVLVSGLMGRVENAIKSMSATNWAMWNAVADESPYVQTLHEEIEPFVTAVRSLLPTSYFRSFCDKFAASFTAMFYDTLIRFKKISEPGTQQLLLDVCNLKTLFLKLPVLEVVSASSTISPVKKTLKGSTIAPAMYTKLVQKQFGRIETLLKLVGTPNELLIENFKVQWTGGTAIDLQNVMSLKGFSRASQVGMLEKFGVDPTSALKGATAGVSGANLMSERVQQLQDQGSTVASKLNTDLSQMRQKVDDFRKTFRTAGSNISGGY